jgi:hypothetical protein
MQLQNHQAITMADVAIVILGACLPSQIREASQT